MHCPDFPSRLIFFRAPITTWCAIFFSLRKSQRGMSFWMTTPLRKPIDEAIDYFGRFLYLYPRIITHTWVYVFLYSNERGRQATVLSLHILHAHMWISSKGFLPVGRCEKCFVFWHAKMSGWLNLYHYANTQPVSVILPWQIHTHKIVSRISFLSSSRL